jgi:photosystem II stability/assembly factor-like uncharacterized protein
MTLRRVVGAVAALGLLLGAGAAHAAGAADWQVLPTGSTERLRGLSVVDAQVAWASGNGGTVVRTVDGGKHWDVFRVPGASELDFRDVEGFSAQSATVLAVGPGELSRIFHTADGGRTWQVQLHNKDPRVFLDAMAFWDERNGLAFGDPVDGRFVVLRTADGGATWSPVPPEALPPILENEGGFAASGTSIATLRPNAAWFSTGSPSGARVYSTADRGRTWQVADAPLARGESAGGYSLLFWSPKDGVVVGGNHRAPGSTAGTAAFTQDGGRTWQAATALPRGYRSAVTLVPGAPVPTLVAAGPSGSELSTDGGRTWAPLSTKGFHAVAADPSGGLWAVGEEGRAARLTLPKQAR